MPEPIRKRFSEVKVSDSGQVKAVFATLNVIDSDGDVTLPGFFEDGQKVRISAYQHGSWKGALPVGKGTIRVVGTEAILDGQFFMSTTHGKDTFLTVKGLEDLGEWSYGFDIAPGGATDGEFDGQSVRFLGPTPDGKAGGIVHEVSPVLLGAGVGTRTLAAKGRGGKQLDSELHQELRDAGAERWGTDTTYVYAEDIELDEGWVVFEICQRDGTDREVRVSYSRAEDGGVTLGSDETEVERVISYAPKSKSVRSGRHDTAAMKLSDHIESVIADIEGLTERAASVVTQRAEKGKSLAEASPDVMARLESAQKRLRDVLANAPHVHDQADADALKAILHEAVRFEEHRFRRSRALVA